MTTDSRDCSICTEKYTDKKRASITCPHCNTPSCLECYQTFTLNNPDEPKCPQCNKPIDEAHLRKHIPISFWNGPFKKSRLPLLLDREVSMISASMAQVEVVKNKEKAKVLIKNVDMQILELTKQLRDLKNQKSILARQQRLGEEADLSQLAETSKKKASLKCAINGCKGFCEKGQCIVCSAHTCVRCHIFIESVDDHECTQDDLDTVKLLSTNTKRCPNCDEGIFKAEGCDQMFCTGCNTGFSWKTGAIVTGRLHNPHYFQMLQQGNNPRREVNDIQCGGLPRIIDVRTSLSEQKDGLQYYERVMIGGQSYPREDFFTEMYRLTQHMRDVTFPRFLNLEYGIGTNMKERVQYILGSISKKQFSQIIMTKENIRKRNIELRDLCQTYVDVVEDLFRRSVDSNDFDSRIEKRQSFRQEFNQINNYFEKTFYIINDKYGSQETIESLIGGHFFSRYISFINGTDLVSTK